MPHELGDKIIDVARKYIGTTEVTRNSGPLIDQWLHNVHCYPGDPWCVAFAWSMLDEATRILGLPNPQRPTASVHWLWRTAPIKAKTRDPIPGSIFCIDHGGGMGHCGIVVGKLPQNWQAIKTIEGNTSDDGSREGKSVCERSRYIPEITLGYIDYSRL